MDYRRLMPGMRAAALLLDGGFRADVVTGGDDSLPDSVRVAACRRIAKHFPWPIHPRRWPPCNEALGRVASSPAGRDALLRERVLAAISELTPDFAAAVAPEAFGASVPPLFSSTEAQAAFRTLLGKLVEGDLLGDARPFEASGASALDMTYDLTLLDPRLDSVTEWCVALRPHATRRERELLDLLDRDPMTTAEEAAAALGCEPVTIRVMCSNLKRKHRLASA
jgi:hypothetical protein